MAENLLKTFSVVGGIGAFGLLVSGLSQWRAAGALQTIGNAQLETAGATRDSAIALRDTAMATRDSYVSQ